MMLIIFFLISQNDLSVYPETEGFHVFECGNAFYDPGRIDFEVYLTDALNPDKISGVRFDPQDFGYPYPSYIHSICQADFIFCTICAPVVRVFVYGETNGLPDENKLLTSFYVSETGKQNAFEVEFMPSIRVDGPFWVLRRGDPSTPGGVLGIEVQDPPGLSVASYSSHDGIPGLGRSAFNMGIRVTLHDQPGPLPVPAMKSRVKLLFVLLLAGVGVVVVRKRGRGHV